MNKKIITLLMTVLSINISAMWTFRSQSDFYLSSKGVNLLEVEDENLALAKDIIKDYNGLYDIDLINLMNTYDYKIVSEKLDFEGRRFLISFDLDGKKVPKWISKNDNFIWSKLYEDTDIALNIQGNFVYSFDKNQLIISNSINLFFLNEELKYYQDEVTLEESDSFKDLFENEEYNFAYMTNNNFAKFYGKNYEKTKKILDVDFVDTYEYEIDTTNYVLSDATKLTYKNDLGSISSDLEVLLPSFGKNDISSTNGIQDSFSISGNGYVYIVVNTFDEYLAKETLVDAIEEFVFIKKRDLELVNDENGFSYVQLPLIYKKIYITNLDQGKLLVTDNLSIIERINSGDIKDKKIILNNNQNLIVDYEQKIKELEYYDQNIFITVKEGL